MGRPKNGISQQKKMHGALSEIMQNMQYAGEHIRVNKAVPAERNWVPALLALAALPSSRLVCLYGGLQVMRHLPINNFSGQSPLTQVIQKFNYITLILVGL